jgi:hypothetical protein
MLEHIDLRPAVGPMQLFHFDPYPPVQLYQVLHDYEIPNKEIRAGMPEVMRLEPNVATIMDEDFQWFAFDLLFWRYRQGDRSGITDVEKRIWNSVYQGRPGRFITNGAGVEEYANFITGERLPFSHNFIGYPKFYNLVCGGNVLTGSEIQADNGERLLLVQALSGVMPSVYNVRRSTCPWLVQVGTSQTGDFIPGTQTTRVEPFPQFANAGMAWVDVHVPIASPRPATYPLRYLRKLPLGSAVPSPYNPPR